MRVGIASTSAPARHVVAAPARRRVTTMAAKGPFFCLFFFVPIVKDWLDSSALSCRDQESKPRSAKAL